MIQQCSSSGSNLTEKPHSHSWSADSRLTGESSLKSTPFTTIVRVTPLLETAGRCKSPALSIIH
eukprot:778477-Rhodomonas_salina.3